MSYQMSTVKPSNRQTVKPSNRQTVHRPPVCLRQMVYSLERMRSTILRLPERARPVALVLALLLAATSDLDAHEIPTRVTVLTFVKAEAGWLRVVVRAPLEAMRDVDFPRRGLGFLDLARAQPLADQAARTWIADYIRAFENGRELEAGRIVASRISLPSDRAFAAYETAVRGVLGPALPPATEVPWTQAALDVVIDFPIESEQSRFSIHAQFAPLGVQTTTVLRYITADGVERAYQYTGDPGIVRLDPAWYHAGWQFVKLGVGHILGGIDHLLFVLCLVIPFRRFRHLVVIVTAFTVAHSITLVSAAMGIVPDAIWFPPLIETLIAASIVYMALENIVGAELRRRWAIAFAFGLVHGFGFSFALAESLQFAGGHLALSLFTFNVGVEIGQILVLAVAVPLVSLLFRRAIPERVGVIIMSAFIAHTAWHWMTERGSSLREYQFGMPAFDLVFAAGVMRAAIVLTIAAAAGWAMLELHRRLSRSEPRPTSEPRT